jgi:hypothetical protein
LSLGHGLAGSGFTSPSASHHGRARNGTEDYETIMSDTPSECEWYLGVACRKCFAPIILFADPSKGKLKVAGEGKLHVTCSNPNCRWEDDYGTDKVDHFRVFPDKK